MGIEIFSPSTTVDRSVTDTFRRHLGRILNLQLIINDGNQDLVHYVIIKSKKNIQFGGVLENCLFREYVIASQKNYILRWSTNKVIFHEEKVTSMNTKSFR